MNKVNKIIVSIFLLSLCVTTTTRAQDAANYPDMSGKTILITGSTDGLGREVAIRLGKLGAHMLIHGRNIVRGSEVVADIKNNGGSAQFYQADFGSLDNVRNMAEAIKRDHPGLDVLVNNAGLGAGFAGGERRESKDGYEMLFQVNYLSHYLLTELLLPTLLASAPSRIINIASRAQIALNFDDLNQENEHSGRVAYRLSKIAQVMHTFYYAELLEGTGVTFNTLHPASRMNTTLVLQTPGPVRSTVDEGAKVVMYVVTSPELEERTGIYFDQFNEGRAHEQTYDIAARERLDKMTRDLLGLPARE
ncbi:MAG: SDR family NAD(P)-dependent oxidoreductase [Gammaproteobacteria bacterium]|jgi:NAD(P)-dependent dehydrogenase (short-subunit alcohol dehydrogenase family)